MFREERLDGCDVVTRSGSEELRGLLMGVPFLTVCIRPARFEKRDECRQITSSRMNTWMTLGEEPETLATSFNRFYHERMKRCIVTRMADSVSRSLAW